MWQKYLSNDPPAGPPSPLNTGSPIWMGNGHTKTPVRPSEWGMDTRKHPFNPLPPTVPLFPSHSLPHLCNSISGSHLHFFMTDCLNQDQGCLSTLEVSTDPALQSKYFRPTAADLDRLEPKPRIAQGLRGCSQRSQPSWAKIDARALSAAILASTHPRNPHLLFSHSPSPYLPLSAVFPLFPSFFPSPNHCSFSGWRTGTDQGSCLVSYLDRPRKPCMLPA